MLTNNLKFAWRSLLKNKGYSLLNIIGLAIGLATCMLILLYTSDELSYDRFNKNAENIYRVNNEIKYGGNHLDLAVAPALEGPTIVKEFPQVENYCRITGGGSLLIKKTTAISGRPMLLLQTLHYLMYLPFP